MESLLCGPLCTYCVTVVTTSEIAYFGFVEEQTLFRPLDLVRQRHYLILVSQHNETFDS